CLLCFIFRSPPGDGSRYITTNATTNATIFEDRVRNHRASRAEAAREQLSQSFRLQSKEVRVCLQPGVSIMKLESRYTLLTIFETDAGRNFWKGIRARPYFIPANGWRRFGERTNTSQ